MRELAENDVVLSQEQLRDLWDEMQDVMQQEADEHPEEKTEARRNMQHFLEMLFRELSSTNTGNIPVEHHCRASLTELFRRLPAAKTHGTDDQ